MPFFFLLILQLAFPDMAGADIVMILSGKILPLVFMAAFSWSASALPVADGGPEDVEIVAGEQRDGYRCLLVEYSAGEPGAGVQGEAVGTGERLRSYLLVPDSVSPENRVPGIVLLHDHGARFDIGKEKLVRPLSGVPENIRLSSEQWVRNNFDGVYWADSLASEGYAVIVPDMLYWGGRSSAACRKWSELKFSDSGNRELLDSLKTAVYDGQKDVYDSLAAEGQVWAWKTMEEDAAAARVLASMDFADSSRIYAAGWSMGAHRAWLLTAFCPEISAGASLCWMTLKETVALPYKASDYAMLVPALRSGYDFPDIALKLAPRPYLFLNGTCDRLFPVPAVKEAFSRMQEIYRDKGAEGRLRTEFFEGGHHCGKDVQRRISAFFGSLSSQDIPAPMFSREKTVPLSE